MREKIGLWLVRVVLRITGNGELANISRVLPLIPQRHLAIGLEPLDSRPSGLLSERGWILWRPVKPSVHSLPDQLS